MHRRFKLDVDAHQLSIVSFSTDADDPSAGLTLTLAHLQLALVQALNRPAPGVVRPDMSRITAKR